MRTIKSGLRQIPQSRIIKEVDNRIRGRSNQIRRLRLWTASPYCEACGRLTDFPNGFEVDHKVRLADGGSDTDENCQILCIYYEDGQKNGCHAEKTKREASK